MTDPTDATPAPATPAPATPGGNDDLHAIAALLAHEAGVRLLAVRAQHVGGYAQLKDAGDRAGHELIVHRLAELRPGDAVLSEEGADDRRRLAADRVWIVDPLDGTREYAEGRGDWAVHVACWEQGRLVAGAVALPTEELVFVTPTPSPEVRPVRQGAPRLVVSRTRPPPLTWPLREALGGEAVGIIGMGSAGAKAMAVVRGDAEVYAHAGGQYEWDSAAPVAVAAAAGLHVSRIDGGPLVYNRPSPWLPDLLVCVPELADVVLAAVRDYR